MPRTSGRPALDLDRSLTHVQEQAVSYWHDAHLLDDLRLGEILQHMAELGAASKSHGLHTVGDLLRASAIVIQTLAGRPLHVYAPAEVAERMHTARNTIAALTVTAALVSHRGAREALAMLPTIQSANGVARRPLREDEILLLRTTSLLRAAHGDWQAPCQYALTEAGSWPSETTAVRPIDFDDDRDPTKVHVPGVAPNVGPRDLPLSEWSRPLLRSGLNAHLARYAGADQAPFVYRGIHPSGSNKASASASGNLARLLRVAGYKLDLREPLNIVRWRARTLLDDQGIQAATDFLGFSDHSAEQRARAKTYTFIHVPRPQPARISATPTPRTYLGL